MDKQLRNLHRLTADEARLIQQLRMLPDASREAILDFVAAQAQTTAPEANNVVIFAGHRSD